MPLKAYQLFLSPGFYHFGLLGLSNEWLVVDGIDREQPLFLLDLLQRHGPKLLVVAARGWVRELQIFHRGSLGEVKIADVQEPGRGQNMAQRVIWTLA